MSLPTDRDARNALPVWDGCILYFPDCWAEIAKVSVLGNKQHALGDKLRFARDVSTDHQNKVMRHMLDHAGGAVFDEDGTMHLAKAAWRALAALQVAIEEHRTNRTNSEQNLNRAIGSLANQQADPQPHNQYSHIQGSQCDCDNCRAARAASARSYAASTGAALGLNSGMNAYKPLGGK